MPERVVVAMSGGVDSSVAVALLVEQGFEVIGVMLRLWSEADSELQLRLNPQSAVRSPQSSNRCCSVEAITDAQSVADRLDIPFYVINVEQPFKEQVVDLFVAEYAAGRTPNPCLACNRKIRFGYLLNYARTLGARYLATGHYARVRRDALGHYQLWRGVDRAKDQSDVLSVLGQADLDQVLFPAGEYTKPQVRALASERGLPTASTSTAKTSASSRTAIIAASWPITRPRRCSPVRSSTRVAVSSARITACRRIPLVSGADWGSPRRDRSTCWSSTWRATC